MNDVLIVYCVEMNRSRAEIQKENKYQTVSGCGDPKNKVEILVIYFLSNQFLLYSIYLKQNVQDAAFFTILKLDI
jgi:hypothetical protein